MLDEEYVGAQQKAMITLDEIEVLGYEVLTVIHNEDATDVKLDVAPRARCTPSTWACSSRQARPAVGRRSPH